MSVANDRRYIRGQRCPICGGADNDARGAGKRCWGFLSDDGDWAHCSREEMAGTLDKSPSNTYGHRLAGSCACGNAHAKPIEERAPRAVDIGPVVAEYNYHDESGVLLYQVRRHEPKAFRQRRPDGSGGWIGKLDPPGGTKTRRVLYRLDRVMEADPDTIIWIVEGEKDVHAMELIGLTATCGPMGAGKFHMVVDCAKKHLRGRHVVVIADDDTGSKEPTKGIDHARDVAKRLKDVAATVRVIEKPARGHDAASWIEAGGTPDEFLAAVPAIEPAKPPSPDEFVYEHGKPIDSQANIKLALRKLGVTIRYDAFGDREVIDGVEMDDTAYNKLRMTIDEKFDFRIGKEFFYDMISNYARDNTYNAVVDYLAGLRWDGVRRIGRWLSSYAGAADSKYTRAVGQIVLVAAVRRARQPGCKFDEMLILEGKQGKNKSTALKILAVRPEWFCDDLPLGADTKKVMEQIQGVWLIEAPELVGLSKADVNALKSMVARQTDTTRMAYGRKRVARLRRFVMIGTTNQTQDYLRDPTGARRFWPVPIEEFDLELLRRDVDQLWAEAAHAEAHGASIRLDPALYDAAAVEQEARRARDSIEIQLASALGDYTGRIPTVEVWRILGIDNRPLTIDEMSRFGSAMQSIGWERERFKENGANAYAYAKGVVDERKRWLTVSGIGLKAKVEVRGGGEPERS